MISQLHQVFYCKFLRARSSSYDKRAKTDYPINQTRLVIFDADFKSCQFYVHFLLAVSMSRSNIDIHDLNSNDSQCFLHRYETPNNEFLSFIQLTPSIIQSMQAWQHITLCTIAFFFSGKIFQKAKTIVSPKMVLDLLYTRSYVLTRLLDKIECKNCTIVALPDITIFVRHPYFCYCDILKI